MADNPGRSGLLRRFHLEVLYRASLGEVSRTEEFQYRIPRRGRHVTEAVYLLETFELVDLHKDGRVTVTTKGLLYLLKRQTHLAENGVLAVQP